MIISYVLANSLTHEMFLEEKSCYYNAIINYSNYENNVGFSKFLEIVISQEGECFIPVVGLSNTLKFIHDHINEESDVPSMRISYPLYVEGKDSKRTANTIIQSINRCPARARLSKIQTSKGLNYYGGQGLIFDEHWNPYMICGFIINIDKINRLISIVRPVCYISPIVFENNDILSKAIIKKVIPYISTGISVPNLFKNCSYLTYNSYAFQNVPIAIEKLDKYFSSPIKPTIIETMNDLIWRFLENNVEDLIAT